MKKGRAGAPVPSARTALIIEAVTLFEDKSFVHVHA